LAASAVALMARAIGEEPVVALIMFSTGKRQAVDHEGGGGVA